MTFGKIRLAAVSAILAAIGAGSASAQCFNRVPHMTDADSPTGTVTRSGVYSSSYEGWRAFDASDTTMWISEVWETPAWLAYEWTTPRYIDRYSITFKNGASLTSRAPRDWTFQGWDGSSWIVLDTRVGETNWAGTETRSYDVASPGSYTRYRLHVTEDNDVRDGIVVISMGRLAFEQCGCAAPSNQVPYMTGPTSPAGTVTRSGVYNSSYEGWRAFDASDSSMWISEVWEAPAWLAYEWSAPRRIERYVITFTNGSLTSRAPRDWTFQGWDGTSWIVLDTRVGETGWAGTETRSYQVASPGAYTRYRLHVTRDNDPRADIVVISMGRLALEGCPLIRIR